MRAGKIKAPGQAEFTSANIPQIGSDDVLIQVHAAGICGTDIHIFKGEYEAQYPLIPGHEFSGVVAGVGDRVTRYEVGDRVTADPNIPCNRCPACQRNEPNQCHNLAQSGSLVMAHLPNMSWFRRATCLPSAIYRLRRRPWSNHWPAWPGGWSACAFRRARAC